MSKVTEIKEVPEPLKSFYGSIEEFHKELNTLVEMSAKTDKLMVKMLSTMTSIEADQVKKELGEITMSMNDLFHDRCMKGDPNSMPILIILMAELMALFKESTAMTAEQHVALSVGGAYETLLLDPRNKESV